jgi:conjugative transposon TraM protein
MDKKKITNYLVYTIATVVFIAIVYVILSPSEDGSDANAAGKLNSNLPEGEQEILPNDKVAAYEDLVQSNEAQIRGLGVDELNVDLSLLNDSTTEQNLSDYNKAATNDEVNAAISDVKQVTQLLQKERELAKKAPSEQAQKPQRDLESERRMKELEETRRRNAEMQKEVLEILRSQHHQGALVAGNKANDNDEGATSLAETGDVSAIPDNHGDIATTLGSQVRRSGGFYGMSSAPVQRNSIRAAVFGAQTVGDGQHLRIRLLEPMMVSGQIIPAGGILVGACKIGVDRLLVSISSIEYGGVITRVVLEVYDNDGQQGLFVPGSMEMEAGREIGADIASSVGSTAASQTSMFSQQSASEQIKADVGRGVVQGTFKFIGKKLQEVKVTVQDKHKVFLISQK